MLKYESFCNGVFQYFVLAKISALLKLKRFL